MGSLAGAVGAGAAGMGVAAGLLGTISVLEVCFCRTQTSSFTPGQQVTFSAHVSSMFHPWTPSEQPGSQGDQHFNSPLLPKRLFGRGLQH